MTRLLKIFKLKENMDQTQKQPVKIHIQHIQKVLPAKTKIIAEPGCRPIGS
jgi:hypothetical protein